MREKVTVLKLDPHGAEKWRYEGEVIQRGEGWLVIEAFFDRDDWPFMGVTLRRGDRFVETYYNNRWFNVFEIFDREDGALKGYYCNVSRPARFVDGRVEYEDLFLDLWVSPEGVQTVLDEDEFDAAEMDDETRRAARVALEELQQQFESKRSPR